MVRHCLVEQVELALMEINPAVDELVGRPVGETAMALFNVGVADFGDGESTCAE